jgi:hypothetical protein
MNDDVKITNEKKPVDEQKPNIVFSPITEDERSARKRRIDAQKVLFQKSAPNDYEKT